MLRGGPSPVVAAMESRLSSRLCWPLSESMKLVSTNGCGINTQPCPMILLSKLVQKNYFSFNKKYSHKNILLTVVKGFMLHVCSN